MKEPLIIREPASYPFEIISSDQFVFGGSSYLVIADNYSGWFDFKKLKSKETAETIKHLQNWFATFGIPKELRTDNGGEYDSGLMKKFKDEWKFEHITSSPRFPQSNGFAERYVQIAKKILKKCNEDSSSVEIGLMNYRNSPRDDKLGSPNERFLCRKTNTIVPMIEIHTKPKIIENVTQNLQIEREKQKFYFDQHVRQRDVPNIGEKVNIQDPATKIWQSGIVVALTNKPRSVIIKTDEGVVLRRNTIHIRRSSANIVPQFDPVASTNGQEQDENNIGENEQQANQNQNNLPRPYVTRSGRTVKPVDRMNL